MKKLSTDLFEKYKLNPLAMDAEVRAYCDLPDNRYYTVSMWPEATAGEVEVTNQVRVVKAKKVSKSDQT